MYIDDNISLCFLSIKNTSDSSCREDQTTNFMFNTFFSSKTLLFIRQRGKILIAFPLHK